LPGSIAQLSYNDPFHIAGGLDGGMKVSGGDNFAAPEIEFWHLPGAGLPNIRHASRYLKRIQGVMRIDHGWRQGTTPPPIFWAMTVFCQWRSGL